MRTDIQSRGFTLSPALRDAVLAHADHYREHFPRLTVHLTVRLFDVNGLRGGPDKCCLVHARLDPHGGELVASSIDRDLYLAIAHSFAKVARSTGAMTRREKPKRRVSTAGRSRAPLAVAATGFATG